MRLPLLALLLTITACGDPASGLQNPPPKDPDKPSGANALTLEHDFGMLAHGESRVHEFELDLDKLGSPFVPLRVHIECSCGHADVRLRKADGSERFIDGSGYARNRPNEDERAILHIELDTRKKEAADLPMTQSKGYVLLQPVDDMTGMGRIKWPFLVRFGIDAPVKLHPYTELAFGNIAQSQVGKTLTTLRGDEAHPDVTFSNVQCSHPDVAVTIEPVDGHTVLRATATPTRLGNHRALITVDTSLENYRVNIQATWKVVADLEATPMPKVSFSAPLADAQPESARIRQFVLVTDHDDRRDPEFVVRELVDGAGNDRSSCFEIIFQELPERPRQRRMLVRYLGGLKESFRGQIILGKRGSVGARMPIDLVVFPGKRP